MERGCACFSKHSLAGQVPQRPGGGEGTRISGKRNRTCKGAEPRAVGGGPVCPDRGTEEAFRGPECVMFRALQFGLYSHNSGEPRRGRVWLTGDHLGRGMENEPHRGLTDEKWGWEERRF